MSKVDFSGGVGASSMRKLLGFIGAGFRRSRAAPPVHDTVPAVMTQAEALLRLNKLSRWLIAAMLVLSGFYIWSLFVSDRYQALCQLSYWNSASSQIGSCDEIKSELANYR